MKALILCGGWQGHQPKLVAKRFKGVLEKDGYEVEIVDSLQKASKIDFKAYNLIMPLWTMAKDKPINNKVIKKVCDAVNAGCGLASCHGGIIDAFRLSTDWQYMTGA